MKAYIILHSWTRGNDNAHRDVLGNAYPSKEEAMQAIADNINDILSHGDEPEGLTIEPAPVMDEENCNHNHGALKFLPQDTAGTSQVEAWGPLPDGIDDPRMADWYECFEVEAVEVPDDAKARETVISIDKEYVTDDIRRIGEHMWNGTDGAPKDPVRFDNPVAITLVTDGRGYLDIRDFFVSAVLAGRDDIPMVEGSFDNNEKQECLPLICHDTQYGHYYEDRYWNVEALVKAMGL